MARKNYDKKTVTCYLPSTLEKQVQEYCTENELTRRVKDEEGNEIIEPRWGTGIVAILNEYFNSTVHNQVQTDVKTQVQNQVQDTVQENVPPEWEGELDGVKKQLADQQETINQLVSKVETLEERTNQIESGFNNRHNQGDEQTKLDLEETENDSDPIADDLPDEVTQRVLAEAYEIPETTLRDYLTGRTSPRGGRKALFDRIMKSWEKDKSRKKWIKRRHQRAH